MERQRSNEISPYVTVGCEQDHVRNFQERFTTWCGYLILLFLLPLSVYLSARRVCVHRRWSIAHHRTSMDFGPEGGCGRPYFAAPPTSARVQNRVEFVELARDMSCNCAGDFHATTGISGWYQVPAPTTRAPCRHPVGKRM